LTPNPNVNKVSFSCKGKGRRSGKSAVALADNHDLALCDHIVAELRNRVARKRLAKNYREQQNR